MSVYYTDPNNPDGFIKRCTDGVRMESNRRKQFSKGKEQVNEFERCEEAIRRSNWKKRREMRRQLNIEAATEERDYLVMMATIAARQGEDTISPGNEITDCVRRLEQLKIQNDNGVEADDALDRHNFDICNNQN